MTVDDAADTITYHLSAADPAFLYQLALPFGAALPASAPDIGHPVAPLPATGPYLITRYAPNQAVVLSRNPRFRSWSAFAQPAGFPTQITLRLGLRPEAQADAVAAGRADVALDTPPPATLANLDRRVPRQLHSYALAETDAVFLDTRRAPFNRPSVRRAIALAVDRARLVQLHGGPQLARPTCQILPPEFPGYHPYCPSTISPGPDGAWHGTAMPRARALIAASRTAGASVTVGTVADDPVKLATGRYFVRLLDALGYNAQLRTYPDDHAYYDHVGARTSRTLVGIFGWEADYQAGSAFFGPLFTCAAYRPYAAPNLNPAGYCNRRIDGQIAHATSDDSVNIAAANRNWQRIDAEITRDAPWIPVVNPLGIDLVSAITNAHRRSASFSTSSGCGDGLRLFRITSRSQASASPRPRSRFGTRRPAAHCGSQSICTVTRVCRGVSLWKVTTPTCIVPSVLFQATRSSEGVQRSRRRTPVDAIDVDLPVRPAVVELLDLLHSAQKVREGLELRLPVVGGVDRYVDVDGFGHGAHAEFSFSGRLASAVICVPRPGSAQPCPPGRFGAAQGPKAVRCGVADGGPVEPAATKR